MIELTIGDLHSLAALATALNNSGAANSAVRVGVGPDTNRHEVEVTPNGVNLTDADALPDVIREPEEIAGE